MSLLSASWNETFSNNEFTSVLLSIFSLKRQKCLSKKTQKTLLSLLSASWNETFSNNEFTSVLLSIFLLTLQECLSKKTQKTLRVFVTQKYFTSNCTVNNTISERVDVPSEFRLCLREFCPKVQSHLEQAIAREAPIFSQNSAFWCR